MRSFTSELFSHKTCQSASCLGWTDFRNKQGGLGPELNPRDSHYRFVCLFHFERNSAFVNRQFMQMHRLCLDTLPPLGLPSWFFYISEVSPISVFLYLSRNIGVISYNFLFVLFLFPILNLHYLRD